MEESTSASASPACASGSTPCRKFGYDNWSNMYVSATRVMSRASFTPSGPSNFNANNQLLIQNSGYDPAGNQTAIGGFTFAYDHEGRVKTSTLSSTATTYTYDGLGRRVSKSTGAAPNIVTTTFVYDASGNLAAEYGGTVTEAGARYLTADHLGSTRLVTKDDGTPDRRIDYLPFGEFMPAGVGGRTTAMKYEASETLAALTQRFTGKERDAETGLDYMDFRYYGSSMGRFTSPDPLMASANVADPQSWNRYVYANNNPLRYTDPLGLYASPAFNCSEGSNACLNDDQRRILNNSTIEVKGVKYSGEALYGKMTEKQQNAFVNITDKLRSIKVEGGGTALGQVQGITGDPRPGKSGTIADDRIFANVSSFLEGSLKATGNFSSSPGHGPFSNSLKSTDGPLGNIQTSFQGTHADIDIDIGNMKAKGFGAVLGGIVHTGEVIQNGLFKTTTNQDVVRRILIADPKVGITPSTDARFNRK